MELVTPEIGTSLTRRSGSGRSYKVFLVRKTDGPNLPKVTARRALLKILTLSTVLVAFLRHLATFRIPVKVLLQRELGQLGRLTILQVQRTLLIASVVLLDYPRPLRKATDIAPKPLPIIKAVTLVRASRKLLLQEKTDLREKFTSLLLQELLEKIGPKTFRKEDLVISVHPNTFLATVGLLPPTIALNLRTIMDELDMPLLALDRTPLPL